MTIALYDTHRTVESMPTESEFLAAASQLNEVYGDVLEQGAIVQRFVDDSPFEGESPVRDSVDQGLESITMMVTNAGAELHRLVLVLEERAGVCRRYVEEYNLWFCTMEGHRPADPPKPPFDWVER